MSRTFSPSATYALLVHSGLVLLPVSFFEPVNQIGNYPLLRGREIVLLILGKQIYQVDTLAMLNIIVEVSKAPALAATFSRVAYAPFARSTCTRYYRPPLRGGHQVSMDGK